jgi:Schlafen, AlbA_2
LLLPDRPITVEHIQAFCGTFNEGYRVEYKGTFDANVREKVPKVVSSFANSHGGVLIVGVNTANGVPRPPFQGFQPSPREEFPLTVENICLQNIYPPVLPQTTVVASDVAGYVFLVIEVDESAQAPHAIENSTKVYVRTGNATHPYDLADIDLIFNLEKRRKEPFELRARLLERAKKRFDTHLHRMHGDRGGSSTDVGTLLRFSVGPRFPTSQLCQYEGLAPVIRGNFTPWRGVMFPNPGSAILFQHESAVMLDAARGTSVFEVNVWGLLFYGAQISVQVGETTGINLSAFLGYVLFFIRHAARMLRSLGYSGPVAIEVALSPVLRVRWLHDWSGWAQAEEGSQLDDDVTLEVPTITEAMQENPDGVAVQIFRHVFFSVNCADLVDTEGKLDALVRKGYEFNNWRH